MRIVLLNQFFWPDTSATSQMLSDVARCLAKEHDILVICARSGTAITKSELVFEPGVSVIRTGSGGFGRGTFRRLSSYLSYLAGCFISGMNGKRPDVYVTLTTPPVLPIVGSMLSTLRGATHVIWEMDVYPDIATDVCYFKPGGLMDQVSGRVLDWSRRRSDGLIVLGDDMKSRVAKRGIAEDKMSVIENWADGDKITPLPFPDGPLVVYYSGNFGLAHETTTIRGVIERLANHPDFQFVFVGGGCRRAELEEICAKQKTLNVDFPPYCKREDLGQSLANGHLGLVTQLPQTLGSVVPSKIYGIMAAGRPLLFIGPSNSTPARHIRKFHCGWHIQPGDVDGLESLLMQLRTDRYLLYEAGRRAREAFESEFDSEASLAAIKSVIEGTISRQQLTSQRNATT
jgi:colanic acid biosynthesis glycosyl transferase WcaI